MRTNPDHALEDAAHIQALVEAYPYPFATWRRGQHGVSRLLGAHRQNCTS